MSLWDDFAVTLANGIMSDDVTEACLVLPAGALPGAASRVLLAQAAGNATHQEAGPVMEDQRIARLLTSLVQALTLALLGTARGLKRGDVIRVASGSQAGDWLVTHCEPTRGGTERAQVQRTELLDASGAQRNAR